MRASAAGIVISSICGICALGGTAHADRADQLFKKGKKLLAEKKYAEACTAFEDSDRLEPGIGAKLNVAKCYQEWGKLATAWRWFSDAEQMAKATKDDRARKIHALAEELDASVPRLTMKVPPDADTSDVVVKLDGVALDIATLGTERRIDPGPHQIDYVIHGAKQTKVIPLERGGSSEITLVLPTKQARPIGPEVGSTDAAADQAARTRRLGGLGLSGAGVAAVSIAAIVTIQARGDYKDALAADCRGAADMCNAAGVAATHDARHRANLATIITLGGLATVAGGLYLYFTAPEAARHGEEHALYVAPSIGGDGTGVVLGGAF